MKYGAAMKKYIYDMERCSRSAVERREQPQTEASLATLGPQSRVAMIKHVLSPFSTVPTSPYCVSHQALVGVLVCQLGAMGEIERASCRERV